MTEERPHSPSDRNREAGPPERGLLASFSIVASATLLSRILGLVRDIVMGRLFGLSTTMDAFAFAFRIPNLARRLFGEGALTAAFLPVFTREWRLSAERGHRDAWELTTLVLYWLGLVLIISIGGLMGGVMFARTFVSDTGTRLLLGLTTLMLPYALLICLAAQVSAVLQSLGRFSAPALAPVVLNLVWIAAMLWLVPRFPAGGPQAYVLAMCILVAGLLQMVIQIPGVWASGYRGQRAAGWWSPAFAEVVATLGPVTFGLSIGQISALLDGAIAWLFMRPLYGGEFLPGWPGVRYPLDTGALAALYFGERLYQFPLGMLGVALGTVFFPRLARHGAEADREALGAEVTLGLRLSLILGIPASVGLWLVARPTVDLILVHGEFGEGDARRTAAIVCAYALGVWAFCCIPLLYRAFYAIGDRVAPIQMGFAAMASDMLLNLTLIWVLGELGLALSTAFAGIVHFICLFWRIRTSVPSVDQATIFGTVIRAFLGCLLMAIVIGVISQSVAPFVTMNTSPDADRLTRFVARLTGLALPVIGGVGTYGSFLMLIRAPELLLWRTGRVQGSVGA